MVVVCLGLAADLFAGRYCCLRFWLVDVLVLQLFGLLG